MVTSFYSETELKQLGLKSLGENVLISKKASIYSPELIKIGNNVRIDDFCILSGKIELGSYIHIASGCYLYGGKEGIVMESFSALSSKVSVYAATDDYSGEFLTNPTVPDKFRNVIQRPVLIKKHAIIGASSIILPGVIIGTGAAVGSMSLVTRDIPDWTIAMGIVGVPARPLEKRSRRVLEMEKQLLREIDQEWGK